MLIQCLIICIIIKMHCKRLFQMQDLHDVLKRARGVPTTRPWRSKRPRSVATAFSQRAV